MNKTFKKRLFHEYEGKMNFKSNLAKAKEGLSFSVDEKKSSVHKFIPIFATALTGITIGISIYAFLNQGNKSTFISGDEASAKADGTGKQESNGLKDYSYTFGKDNEYYMTVYFDYPTIYFKDEKENMDLKKLIVKGNDELLSIIKEDKHQISYHLQQVDYYQITWEYEAYSGTIE